jgi:hypothetical protein
VSDVVEPAESVEAEAPSTDWKAEARKWESRAKENLAKASENEKAAARLAELDEAQKSETQKLQEKLAEFEGRAATAERDRARLSVLAKHLIPEEFHDLVQGDSAEALEASALKVQSLIGAGADKKRSFVIPDEGGSPSLALNGDGIESSLKKALGIA